jgi:hypothetical protein
MAFIADTVFDNGLTVLDTTVENLYITSAEATTFTEAATTFKLGTKATPTVGAPENGATDGRRVIVSAITDGTVNTTGTATHWALTDDSGSLLLATGALSASQAVTSGNTFTLDAISITIRDAT